MCILFLTEQGASLKKESSRIFVIKDDEELLEIQTRKISAIGILGNIQVSTQALVLLASAQIPVTFLTLDGTIKGEFLPAANKNLHLRYTQYLTVNDESLSLSIAKDFVTRKILSYVEFYRKIQKNEPVENCKALIEAFSSLAGEAEQAFSYSELLGYEGMASRTHFANYGTFFKNELTFSKRSHYPPEDETNALLSLGYTMLFKLINGMLHAAGLDVYNGFLHKPKYNRPSLSCDFEELFRSPWVDAFVLKLANKGMIKKKHFSASEQGPRLTQEGLTIFFSQWKELAYPTHDSELVVLIQKEILNFIKTIQKYQFDGETDNSCTLSPTTSPKTKSEPK